MLKNVRKRYRENLSFLVVWKKKENFFFSKLEKIEFPEPWCWKMSGRGIEGTYHFSGQLAIPAVQLNRNCRLGKYLMLETFLTLQQATVARRETSAGGQRAWEQLSRARENVLVFLEAVGLAENYGRANQKSFCSRPRNNCDPCSRVMRTLLKLQVAAPRFKRFLLLLRLINWSGASPCHP